MKKIWLLIVLSCLTWSCSENDFNNNNPYLPNYSFSITIDLNLPAYNNLLYPSNGITYSGPGVGAKGTIIVFNTGSGYVAYDAACPNQSVNSCSVMTINGINAVCSCDKVEYSLYTGLGSKEYPMKPYRVSVNGNMIRVYN